MIRAELNVFDVSVSQVENYLRAARGLREQAETLARYMEPSKVNLNGKMGSDEAIERQRHIVLCWVHYAGALDVLSSHDYQERK